MFLTFSSRILRLFPSYLVDESGQKGAKVVVISPDDEVEKAVGVYLASVLNQIGFKATAKTISGNIAFTYVQNTKNKVQINVQQWYQDYPAASDFLHILFGCESFHPGSDSSINIAGFCDKKIDADMHKALTLAVTNEDAANLLWEKVDREVTDASFDEPIEPWRLWVLTIGCVWMAACAIALAILGNWWLGISNGALAVMFGWAP